MLFRCMWKRVFHTTMLERYALHIECMLHMFLEAISVFLWELRNLWCMCFCFVIASSLSALQLVYIIHVNIAPILNEKLSSNRNWCTLATIWYFSYLLIIFSDIDTVWYGVWRDLYERRLACHMLMWLWKRKCFFERSCSNFEDVTCLREAAVLFPQCTDVSLPRR